MLVPRVCLEGGKVCRKADRLLTGRVHVAQDEGIGSAGGWLPSEPKTQLWSHKAETTYILQYAHIYFD